MCVCHIRYVLIKGVAWVHVQAGRHCVHKLPGMYALRKKCTRACTMQNTHDHAHITYTREHAQISVHDRATHAPTHTYTHRHTRARTHRHAHRACARLHIACLSMHTCMSTRRTHLAQAQAHKHAHMSLAHCLQTCMISCNSHNTQTN